MIQVGISQAAFLLVAMSASGAVHVFWLRSNLSRRFAWPVDGGRKFRGRRLFGDNKRVCGFLVLPPVTALIFMLLAASRDLMPNALVSGLWPLTAWQFAGLGLTCGLIFMMAELPNSFLKRQLGIAPGQPPAQSWLRPVSILLDRYDSVVGVLAVLSLLVPIPLATWIWVLVLGPVLHALFSIIMHGLGLKARSL